jgi:type VI protein secretion system component Hcp
MKRISNEEALNYVPYERTPLSPPPTYFSVFEDIEGWEEIKYYTHRFRQSVNGSNGDQSVYILESESMPEMVKIGYTKGDPIDRANTLSKSTGVPTPFNVVYSYSCFNGERIEKAVHKHFRKQRVNKQREFFYVDLDEAIQIIESLGAKLD